MNRYCDAKKGHQAMLLQQLCYRCSKHFYISEGFLCLFQHSDESDEEENDSSDDDEDDDSQDEEKGITLSTEQMNELSVGSDDEANKQEFTRTVQSSNRRKQRPPGVKVADKPDEYDYDSSDEEVCP